jgi:hypothetical protein
MDLDMKPIRKRHRKIKRFANIIALTHALALANLSRSTRAARISKYSPI